MNDLKETGSGLDTDEPSNATPRRQLPKVLQVIANSGKFCALLLSDDKSIYSYTVYRDTTSTIKKSFLNPKMERETKYINGGSTSSLEPKYLVMSRKSFATVKASTHRLPPFLADRIATQLERNFDFENWTATYPGLREFYKIFLDYQCTHLSTPHLVFACNFLDRDTQEKGKAFIIRGKKTKSGHLRPDQVMHYDEERSDPLNTLCEILRNPSTPYEILYRYQETDNPRISEALRWNPVYPEEWKVVLSLRFFNSPISNCSPYSH